MKWVLRILAVLGILLIFVIGFAGGFILYDLTVGSDVTEYTNISFEANDTTLHGYLAEPDGEGPFPGVLMVHEWWGMRPDMVEKADRLAEEGYVVMAVDAYRTRTASGVPTALYLALSTPQDQINSDMTAFLNYLTELENVDVERTAVMGYCFGGRQSVLFGIEQAERVDAVLTYYGGSQPVEEAQLAPLAENDVAVLGVFGEEDGTIPLSTVETFETSLQNLSVDHQVTVYPGVGHAFVKDLDSPGPSRDAWQEGVEFLNTHLKAAEETT